MMYVTVEQFLSDTFHYFDQNMGLKDSANFGDMEQATLDRVIQKLQLLRGHTLDISALNLSTLPENRIFALCSALESSKVSKLLVGECQKGRWDEAHVFMLFKLCRAKEFHFKTYSTGSNIFFHRRPEESYPQHIYDILDKDAKILFDQFARGYTPDISIFDTYMPFDLRDNGQGMVENHAMRAKRDEEALLDEKAKLLKRLEEINQELASPPRVETASALKKGAVAFHAEHFGLPAKHKYRALKLNVFEKDTLVAEHKYDSLNQFQLARASLLSKHEMKFTDKKESLNETQKTYVSTEEDKGVKIVAVKQK